MANICTFKMRVRGEKDSCHKLLQEGMRQCYEYGIEQEINDGDNTILTIRGECRNNITTSMIEKEDGDSFREKTLEEKSKILNLEIEVFGYDLSEPDWIEHFHYKNGECLKYYNLLPYCYEEEFEELDLSEEDCNKYNYMASSGVYVLAEEYCEPFEFDEENYDMKVSFSIAVDSDEGEDNIAFEMDDGYPKVEDCQLELDYMIESLERIDKHQLYTKLANDPSAEGYESLSSEENFSIEKYARELLDVYLEDGGFDITDFEGRYKPGNMEQFKAFFDEEMKSMI